MKNIYYLGLKERTVQYTKFFKGKILIKKEKNENPFCFEDVYHKEIDYNLEENFTPISNFYDNMIEKILSLDPNAKFMPYNQKTIERMNNLDQVICVNKLSVIEQINNKKHVRELLDGCINCLDYKYLNGDEITFQKVKSLFGGLGEKFVVQEFVGFAGIGTFLFTKDNETWVLKQLKPDRCYSISKYVDDNISINNTFMICDQNIVIFDGSVQNIDVQDQLLYDGWDFEKYNSLSLDIRKKIYNQTMQIAKRLQSLGYVGIGGVDYILKNDNVYFMEINPRFQTSSEVLDEKLQTQGFPSIFELQYMCFYEKEKFNNICKKINVKPS